MVMVEDADVDEIGVRYRLLETIRQYAEMRLAETGEAEAVRSAHRDWYVRLAEQAAVGMEGAELKRWSDRLDLEYDNLRTALTWSAANTESSDALLRLAGSLGRFWQGRGYANEGIAWLETALSQSSTRSSSARARALNWRGVLEMWHGNLHRACTYLDDSVSQARASNDRRVLSMALRHLSMALCAAGAVQRALSLMEEAVGISREEGYIRETAWNLAWLAEVALRTGNLDGVESLLVEAIEQGRQSGDLTPVVGALRSLARVYWMRRDFAHARDSIREALKLAGQINQFEVVLLDIALGDCALAEADRKSADQWYREALRTATRGVYRAVIAYALRRCAALCASGGEPLRAVRILGTASVIHDLPLMLSSAADEEAAAALQTLGKDEFATAWAEGQSITMEQAAAEILGEHDHTLAPDQP
jgi:tetratricopeptide (TPR) repeat protein